MPGGKITLGTRGDDGHSLIRNTENYKENLSEVDFAKRKPSKVKRVVKKAGKTSYVY
jgi:hypothetical protein